MNTTTGAEHRRTEFASSSSSSSSIASKTAVASKITATSNVSPTVATGNFVSFLRNLFGIAQVPPACQNVLLQPPNLALFIQAFTHKSVSSTANYEVYETLGDCSLNKCAVWYFCRSQKDISPEKLTLLKIRFVSTKLMSTFAHEMNFDKYIRAGADMNKHRQKILEDVFESFLGCLESTIDNMIQMHAGYGYVYNFVAFYIEKYLPEININDADLLDPISQIKNIADKYHSRIDYTHENVAIHGIKHIKTSVVMNGNVIGSSIGRTKKMSKVNAAEVALAEFRQGGGGRPPP